MISAEQPMSLTEEILSSCANTDKNHFTLAKEQSFDILNKSMKKKAENSVLCKIADGNSDNFVTLT